ncbi:MAG: U32 family peptidase [Nanoarchaeota archaeon]
MKQPKYKLLAPAGDFPSLISSVEAGADAVYFGLKEFNMRDSARNFNLSDLDRINKICKKVKKYLTLNTIIYDSELVHLEKIIKQVKNKVDAIICWDLSVIKLCKKYKIPFHISTQASVSNAEAAKFYKKLGAERIVLARELNLSQIKKISKIIPIETFIHGAMCVSVSGRCFTSQFLQNRSANRGQCTHPCRRSWQVKDDNGYELKLENSRVMSAKDLCTLPFIEKLKKAGITSFKIEGRNRNPEYVSLVTRIYRKALGKKLTKEEIKESVEELEKVYNRSFSSGFYIKMPTSDDFCASEDGEQKERKEYIGKIEKFWPKISVSHVKIHTGVLKVGKEVYLMHKDSAIIRTKVKSMEINNKSINSVKKGQDVGIKFENDSNLKKGTEIYLIRKK